MGTEVVLNFKLFWQPNNLFSTWQTDSRSYIRVDKKSERRTLRLKHLLQSWRVKNRHSGIVIVLIDPISIILWSNQCWSFSLAGDM